MHLLFSLVFNGLSAWWIIPCLVLGCLYAWFFYQKSGTAPAFLKNILFAMRWLVVSFLALLLLSPLIKTVKVRLQKPVIFIAQDASLSISVNKEKDFSSPLYHQNLKKLAAKLADDYEVKSVNFSDKVKANFDFKESGKQTDISSIMDFIADQNPNNNIGALILATDGVYNKGANPVTQISNTQFPIYTIALGDNIAKKDLVLMPPVYNQLVYLGNTHELEIMIKAFGANGANTNLKATTNDGQTKQQSISFNKNEDTKTLKFTLDANRKGIQKITFDLVSIANELSTQNNKQTIYVEVLDGRDKILLLADAPHPDLSALKQAIESNRNYEVTLAFADNLPAKIDDYGLIILHNLPSATHNISSFLQKIKQKNKWFIVGAETNTALLSNSQVLVEIAGNNQTQSYTAVLNPDFYAFTLAEDTKKYLQNLAPLVAPFANHKMKSAGKVLLRQQIANVKSNAPLLVFGEEENTKTAVLTGEGIWRWRMDDFEKNKNFEAFNDLIGKSVQYLSAKEDKRKFRAQSSKTRYLENESVLLNAALYNDAYELINTPEVSLELKNSDGKKYSYVFSRMGSSYELSIGILPPGEYDFTAKAKLGANAYTAKGSFLVEAVNVELTESEANHQLLFNLSKTTGGTMVYPNQMMSLVDIIKQNEKVKTVSHQEKNYEPLINLKWLFALIVLLLSFEWFLRKRNGAV